MSRLRVLMAATIVAALFFVSVSPAGAECSPGDSQCEPKPLQSRQVNGEPRQGQARASRLAEPGSPSPLGFDLNGVLGSNAGSAGPTFVEVAPLGKPSDAPGFETIDVRMRYQDPSDVSCGVQALGMALDGLGGGSPTSSALLGFLQGSGMIYDFGTGAEELAHAAGNFGYKGSFAFHGWDLSRLQSELAEGRPVVVALGTNGDGAPGHFVTVTGISADASWVAYNDPTQGRLVVPAADFMRPWELQGKSGVAVLQGAPAGAPDYSPWVALLAGLMAVISATPLALDRLGIGGRLIRQAYAQATRRYQGPGRGSGWRGAPSRIRAAVTRRRRPGRPPTPTPTPTDTPTPRPTTRPVAAPVPTPGPAYTRPRSYATPGPRPTPRPTPQPRPAPRPANYTPAYTRRPRPEDIPGKWLARGARLLRSLRGAATSAAVQYRHLASGRVAVSAPSLSSGTRRPYLTGYGYRGTTYNPSTISRINGSGLVRGALKRGSLATAFVTSVAGNVWDYGFGSNRSKGIRSRDFAVSTGVDFAMTVGVGLAAAGTVAGGLALAGAVGLTAVATAPVWAVIGATAAVGIGIALGLEHFQVGARLKAGIHKGLDAWPNNLRMGREILRRLPGHLNRTVVEPAGQTIRQAGKSLEDAGRSIREGARGLFGSLFAGG